MPPGPPDEYATLDATAQAALVRRREVRPEELVQAGLARIDRLNPSLNAVVTPMEPLPAHDGPFAGVPFLVKDLGVSVSGVRATWGSRWLASHVAHHDQEVVSRYRRAGLVLVGTTNTCEFGLSPTCESALFGPARNPWGPERTPGGSSGGSAAAVAAGMVPMAHGDDLGGSLRYPAAWCGLFALKPTRARVPVGPELGDVVAGLWCDHAVTRSVRDAAALLDAVAGPCPGDPYAAPPPQRAFLDEVGRDPGRLRIALSTTPRGGQPVDAAWRGAADAAGRLLESLGHLVDEATPACLDERYDQSVWTVYRAAVAWMVARWCRELGRAPSSGELEAQTRAYWQQASTITAGDCLLAVEDLQRVSRAAAEFLSRYDVWLTPTLGGPAPPLGELVGTEDDPLRGARHAGRCLMFDGELANITGNPAMSVPFGFDDRGLPVGIHALGRFGDEATVLRLAGQLERVHPWATDWPAPSSVPTAPATR